MCVLAVSAQLQQLSNQANGQSRIDSERHLHEQKRSLEGQLSTKAQELLQLRLVSTMQIN